ERLEVKLERLAVGAAADPGRQVVDIGGGQPVVTEFRGEVDDCGRPEAAVEVVVEERLRGLADRVRAEHPDDGTTAASGPEGPSVDRPMPARRGAVHCGP